jgi:hypothetical protein
MQIRANHGKTAKAVFGSIPTLVKGTHVAPQNIPTR